MAHQPRYSQDRAFWAQSNPVSPHPHGGEHLALSLDPQLEKKKSLWGHLFPSRAEKMTQILEAHTTQHPESSAEALLQELSLVCQKDIFTEDGSILLMKAGYEVPAEWVKKLIAHGAKPEFFTLRKKYSSPNPPANGFSGTEPHGEIQEESLRSFRTVEIELDALEAQRQMPPVHQAPIPHTLPVMGQDIVVFDTDEKQLDRLTECLVKAGVPFSRIRPVGTLEHLRWAIRKHKPAAVIVDFYIGVLPGKGKTQFGWSHGLDVLAWIRNAAPEVEHLILTAKVSGEQPELREKVQASAHTQGAEVLFKPTNRYDIQQCLDPYFRAMGSPSDGVHSSP